VRELRGQGAASGAGLTTSRTTAPPGLHLSR
jgi:hypothetical protein